MSVVIQVDRLSKEYRLGQIGGKRLVDDVNRWWAKLRGKEDPLSKIGAQKSGARGQNVSSNSPLASSKNCPSPLTSRLSAPSETLYALKDVSFEVKQGEVLGIIGRNGAGKSTLLKILSRVTAPTSGEVRAKGRIASLLEVGTGFHPELTGRENIFLNGAILGMTKAEIRSKFDEIVDFAEVDQFIDTPVKRYSSGMYVRLAFAVAAHLEPEILIVDEVLAVGDAEFQKKCLGKMHDVAGLGRTVLFVSHNMAAVQNLCALALVLNGGELLFKGSSAHAVDRYLASCRKAQNSQHSLKGRRPNWALPRITAARLLDVNGRRTQDFALGSDVVIEMDVMCPDTDFIRQPVMGIVVNHHRFGTVAGVNMRMTGSDHIKGDFRDFSIRCHLKAMPFLQGHYSVDLWLGDGPRDVDAIEGCLDLQLQPTDVYGTGKLPLQNLGVAFLNAEFAVSSQVA